MTTPTLFRRTLAALVIVTVAATTAVAQGRFLGKEEITVYGLGLKVEPAVQTVPKGFATIVSTFLQGSTDPGALPPFAPDAEVRATLRGPSFAQAIELVARPNSPFQIPLLTVAGTHTLENIRLVSGGQVVLYGSPETARIEVIDKLLVTTVTARPLTAEEIREKGIVFDRESFQAYNFTAAFAIDDGSRINVAFPVVLPTIIKPQDVQQSVATLQTIDVPLLRSLQTIIPDTLQIQARIPNLSVVGFTLTLDQASSSQDFYVPPIPGVIVIPGDIGFLNQFFSVLLMVANVAPGGSNLVVNELTASIVLPPGKDNVVGSNDDPLAMARRAGGETPRIVAVTRPGPDGILGNGDDLTSLGPGETGNAEFLVEGKREGTHVVEMELAGTLNGLPIGPVPVRGRAAGVVLVRNPTFTLTFTHPDIVNSGEPYTLDVTVTNTSESPANFVSLNLFSTNISGARLDDEPSKAIESIAPGDSATVTYRLISNRTGKVTAATLDSDDAVAGRFQLKTAIGELGVPLSPDSLVLPKEAGSLPLELRNAALGLLGRAWAVATAPPAALPKDLSRFSKQVVLDRAVETAEAGFRHTLGESLPRVASSLLMDYMGNEFTTLASRVPANDTTGLLGMLQRDVQGFDLVRRRSVRGDVFADAVARIIAGAMPGGPVAFHRSLAEQFTANAGHVSIFVSANGDVLPVDAILTDASGRRSGPLDGTKVVKDIPFSDVLFVRNASGDVIGQLYFVAVPEAAEYQLQLARRAGTPAQAEYDVSVAYPSANGTLRFVTFSGVGANERPVIAHDPGDPTKIAFNLAGVDSPAPKSGAPAPVSDPPPTVLGVVQMAEADVVGCPVEGRVYPVGRVLAVLFSEEVTAASVQDKLGPEAITAFSPEGNRVMGVALQPGGRIAYIALREPMGPLVPRQLTVQGVVDRFGQVMAAPQTLPIVMTVPNTGGMVSGRVLRADGAAAAFASVRMFFEYICEGDQVVTGIAEEIADANGRYQFDYVLSDPGITVKLAAIDAENDDLRIVRFRLARPRQDLNVDVVLLARGTLKGRTLAEDGRTPLAGSVLRITSATDQSQYSATTDADGAFEVSRIPVGNILIEAVNAVRGAQVFVSERIPVAGAVVARDILLLDVDTTQVAIKKGSVTGRVVKADGITPVTGVPVVAYYQTRSQAGLACPRPPGGSQEPAQCAIGVATTNEAGLFSFGSVPAGELRLNTFDQTDLLEGNVRVTIVENQNFDVTILIAGGFGTVTGVVLDASGHPVPDAVVGGGLSLANVNPADGTFTLTDVPVGRRKIVAVSQALETTGETTIDLVQQGETVNAAIVLQPVGAVAGIVRNREGVPQPGIKVWVFVECFDELEQPSICIKGEAVSSALGAYRIDGLAVGEYSLSAFRGDMKDGNVQRFAVRYNKQVLVKDIAFRGAFGTVSGRVLRACAGPSCADTPLPARVAISGERLVVAGGKIGVKFEYVQNYEIVDNDFTTGAYEFDDVWTGPFTVRAAGQFSPEPIAIEGVMPGPGQTVTVDLRLQPTSRLTGTVFESDGFTPVTNRQVSLRFHSDAVVVFCTEDAQTGDSECKSIPQGIQEAFAATDGAGRFSFPLVNAGPFTLAATDEGTANATGKVATIKGTVRPGDVVDLSLRLLGRAPVTVRVFRSDGSTPVNGATVELEQIDYPRETRNGVAANGTTTFEGGDSLSEGQFVITAIGPGGFAGRASGRVVTDGQPVTVDVFLFDATGTVAGQIVREDEAAGLVNVPNAEVLLSTNAGPIAFAVTDATGAFSIPLVPTGPFTVEAFDPVSAGRGRAAGTVIGGPVPAAVTVRLEALGSIRGIVVQSDGARTPLKGWTVQLSQTTPGGRTLPTQMSQTSVDGTFMFPGASVGGFYLRATQRGVVGDGTATGQVTRGGQLVDVPIVVSIERRVVGRVTGLVALPGGAPAPNAQVELCGAGDPCRASTAGGDGRFTFENVPLGRFTVRGSAQVTGNPSVGTTGGAVLFEGDTAETTVTLLGLSIIEGSVVQIVNGNRQPAANASVRLFGQPGSGCPGACQQSADANGLFRFINVPAQTFTVSASALSGQQGSVGGTLVPGQTKSGLEIVLAPAVSLRGRARLGTGDVAPGVVAELSLNGGKLFAETDTDGLFVFESVGAGAYVLSLQDPIAGGLARRTGTIVVAGGIDLGDITLDEAAPTVAASSPGAGAVGVPQTPEIRVTFSERVNAGTLNATTITLIGPGGPVGGLIDALDNDTVARFRLLPDSQLTDQTRYTLKVSGVKDLAGRTMTGDFVAAFTTLDLTAPTIVETTPTTAASGVTIDATVRIKYSEIVNTAAFTGPAITVTGPGGPVDGRIDFAFSNTVAIFTPMRPLAEDATYAVQVAAATDLSGRQQPAGLQFQFSTTDRTPPVVTALTAANGGIVIENATTEVAASVSPSDVAVVDFFINDTFAFADRVPPFTMALQAAPAFAGPGSRIKVSAVATDTSGNRGIAPVATFIDVVADQPPAVAITQPAGAFIAGTGQRIDVQVQASDDLGLTQIAYIVRGTGVIDAATRPLAAGLITRSESFAFTVPANAAPGSTITIDASAIDSKLQVTPAAPVIVRVLDNIGPSVQITGVSSGQRVRPGQDVTVVVQADDPGQLAAVGLEIAGVLSRIDQRPIAPAKNAVATSFAFTVPAGATSTDRVLLRAFAIDVAGNRGESAQTTLPLADLAVPTVSLRTSTGNLDVPLGRPAEIIVEATDDVAMATLRLSGSGPAGFTFDETRSVAPVSPATASFTLQIPETLAAGDQITLTARAIDASGNASVPVSLTITVRQIDTVTLPPSVLLNAGRENEITVSLGATAAVGGTRVDLVSRNSTIATVTSFVQIAAGQASGVATVTGVRGGTTQIDAYIGGTLRQTMTVTVVGGVVRGTVQRMDAGLFVPAADAQVTVFHGGAPIVTTTGVDGSFEVTGVEGAGFQGRDFSIRATDGTLLGFVDATLDVAGGSADVTVILIAAGSIDGVVTEPDGTTRTGAGVRVDLYETTNPSVAIATAFTDAAGQFVFPLVAPGPYRLDASDQQGNRGRTDAIVVSGANTAITLTYLGKGTVSGVVKSGTGAVVPNANVELFANSVFGQAAVVNVPSGPDGRFSFANVYVGTLTVHARDPITNQAGTAPGQLSANGEALDLTVTLASYGNLRGTVRRPDNATAAPGANVNVRFAGGPQFNTTTDSSGAYALDFLPLGAFTVTARDTATRGLGSAPGSIDTSGQTVTANVTLQGQGALLVTVLDANGSPVNGATVSAQTTMFSLLDSLQGVTTTVDGQPGRVLLDRLMAGSFTLSATASGLQGGTTGTLLVDEVKSVSISLEPQATILGLVLDHDGQTPATGSVRLTRSNGATTNVALVDGHYTATLKLGTYSVEAFDTQSRERAHTSGIVLDSNAETETANLTFVGLGTVAGHVIHPVLGGDVGKLSVQIQSLNLEFGGAFSTVTDAAGNYTRGGIPVGPVVVTVQKPSESLAGESTGTLAAFNQTVSLDVQLFTNSVNLPVSLGDGNGSSYTIGNNAGLVNSTASAFSPGGMALSLTPSGGSPVSFAGASFGTREGGGREVAIRQDGLAGLNVTRKVFVPAAGYFARYVEMLSNPTAQPITVNVDVASRLYSGYNPFCSFQCERSYFVSTTSSGDGSVDVSGATPDRWASLGGFGIDPWTTFGNAPWVAFVFGGDDAAVSAAAAAYEPSNPNTTGIRPGFSYGWHDVTVPPGGSIALMHFVALQGGPAAGTASGQRLVQLPQEAIDGLSPEEIAAIQNFAVPANGVSAVPALPPLTGTISGRVLEGDGTSGVPGAVGFFQSSVGVYPRRLTFGVGADGSFSFTGAIGSPVPIGDFTLQASHPVNSNRFSPVVSGSFNSGQIAAVKDVVFSDGGILTGVVRRPNGTPVAGATVEVAFYATTTTDASGRYRFGGVIAGQPTLRGTLPRIQSDGTALSIAQQTVALAAGATRDDVLVLEPSGSVTGILTNATGQPQFNKTVTLTHADGQFTRSVQTDLSTGRYTFTDMRVGSLTLRSIDTSNGFATTKIVTVTPDQVTNENLAYQGNVTINVLVTRASGAPLQGMTVTASGTGFSVSGTTALDGTVSLANVPVGQVATVLATHPALSNRLRASAVVTVAPGLGQVTLALPAFGTVTGEVRRPNGTLAGAGVRMEASATSVQGSFTYTVNTNASSRYTLGPIPAGQPFNVISQHPTTTISGSFPRLTLADQLVSTDGQELTVNSHYPAIAQLTMTVTENGSAYANAPIREVFFFSSGGVFTQAIGTTNASGVLVLPQVAEGTHTYRVIHPVNGSVREIVITTITAAQDATNVNLAVAIKSYTISIRGMIRDADGAGLPNGQLVNLYRAGDRQWLAQVCVGGAGSCPGPVGQFSISQFDATTGQLNSGAGISTGAGVIVQVRSPFLPFEWPVYERTVVPTADGQVDLIFDLPFRRATVHGRVFAADGITPAGLGAVSLHRVADTSMAINSSPGVAADGTWSHGSAYYPIEGVRAKLWNVRGVVDGVVQGVGAPITAADQDVNIDLQLPADTLLTTITGTVVAGDGITPLESAGVYLTFGTACTPCYTGTNAQGVFEYKTVLPADGHFSIKAEAPITNSPQVTQSYTATTQGATVDAGTLVIPISILKGRVTFGPSLAAPNVTVVISSGGTPIRYSSTDHNGEFRELGLPPGNYTLVAQHYESGNTASTTADIPSATSTVTAQIELPPVGTIRVRVYDQQGNARDASRVVLTLPSSFERYCSVNDDTSPDGAGVCTFDDLPMGNYHAQAALEICDDNGDCAAPLYASGSGTLTGAGQDLAIDLHFDAAGEVVAKLDPGWVGSDWIPGGTQLRVLMRAMGGGGPLGFYEQQTTIAAVVAPMQVMFAGVPRGRFVITVEAHNDEYDYWYAVGRSEGVLAPNVDQPLAVDVSSDNVRGLWYGLNGADNWFYWVADGGQLADVGQLTQTGPSTYEFRFGGAFRNVTGLRVRDFSIQDGRALTERQDAAGREAIIGPFGTNSPIYVSRRIFSPTMGGFVRYLDVFSNDTDVPVAFNANINFDSQGVLSDQSSPTDNTGGFLGFPGGGSRASYAWVYAGPNAPVRPSVGLADGSLGFGSAFTQLTIPPHSQRALLHYVIARGPSDNAAVIAQAQSLMSLSDPAALAGLSSADIAAIANYRFTEIRGRMVAGDGVTPLAGAHVEVASGPCGGCGVTADADGQFTLRALVSPGSGVILSMTPAVAGAAAIERSFSNAAQNGIIEIGNVTLPVSVLSGRVTFGPNLAAPGTVINVKAQNVEFAFAGTDGGGNYLVVGLSPGTYTVTASHARSGHTESVEATIPAAESQTTADIQLARVSSITVYSYESGTGIDPFRVALQSTTRNATLYCSVSEEVKPVDGACTFDYIGSGSYYIQGVKYICDANACIPSFASATASVGSGDALNADLDFSFVADVQVTTDPSWVSSGGAEQDDPLRVTLRSMGGAGPLGAFERVNMIPASADAQTYTFSGVPPGQVVVTVDRSTPDGWIGLSRVQGNRSGDLQTPLELQTAGSDPASGFPYEIGGADNWRLFLDTGGQVANAGRLDGSDLLYTGSFSYLNSLITNGSQAGDARALSVQPLMGNQEVTMGPFATRAPISVARRVFVPDYGEFARYLDVFTNDTDVAVDIDLSLVSQSSSSNVFSQASPSDTSGGFVVYDPDNNRASFGLVYAGSDPPFKPEAYLGGDSDQPHVSGRYRLEPHSRAALMHFVILRDPGDTGGVEWAADQLIHLTNVDALAGLTDEERAMIINFRVPPQ